MHSYDFFIAFLGGILAASNLIIGKMPSAKEYIDKITPYQGFIGVFMLVWGLYNVLNIPDFIKLISVIPVTAIAALVMVVMLVLVGFILGFSLVSKYVLSKNEQAKAKGEQLRAKLAPLTGTLGIVLLAAGTWLLLNFYVLKMTI